jgi:Myotubularin-like phosphatase domain
VAQSTKADHFLVQQLHLAPGERVLLEASRVSMRSGGLAGRKKGTKRDRDLIDFQLSTGNLYLTNFALVFIPFFSSRGRSKAATSLPLAPTDGDHLDEAVRVLPLTSILKAQKYTTNVGSKLQRVASDDKQLLVVQMKDGRTLRVGFNRASLHRRTLLSRLREVIPERPDQTFAFAWHRGLSELTSAAESLGASPSAGASPLHSGGWSSEQVTSVTGTRTYDQWRHYDPLSEYLRLGVRASCGATDRQSGADSAAVAAASSAGGWRLTSANQDYQVCDTYPRQLVVPSDVEDVDVLRIKDFRSRGRLPVLAWRHSSSGGSLTRCGQPRVGLSRARCAEDEQLLEAMLNTNGGGASTAKQRLYLMDARPRLNGMLRVGARTVVRERECV